MVELRNGRTPGKLVIALIDPLPLFRAGLALALQSHYSLLELEHGESMADAIRIAALRHIDIMMIDPGTTSAGYGSLATLSRTWPATKLLVSASSESEIDVSTALKLGARGYVLKWSSESEFLNAVKAVANGEVFLSPQLGARLVGKSSLGANSLRPMPHVELTQREYQIIDQVSAGATNREIATKLRIREKTVKFHMTNIMQKLQVRNRVEAVVAVRNKVRVSA